MSRGAPPDRVPTLTEVLEAPAVFPAVDGEAAHRMMTELQAHIDRVLDARVRAALEPVLQQLLVRVTDEVRRELASTLRDGVTRALAQELSRHRSGSIPR